MKKREVIGETFGELLVLDDFQVQKNNRSRRYLKCKCSCGAETIKEKSKVLRGVTSSCGHLQKQMRANFNKDKTLPIGEAAFNEVYNQYKKGAIKRNLDFNLSKEQFREIITKPCIYCGDSLCTTYSRTQYNGTFSFTGIDRYDNEKGYTIGNCVPCCKICNRMKADLKIPFFKEHLQKILSNLNQWESLSSENISLDKEVS